MGNHTPLPKEDIELLKKADEGMRDLIMKRYAPHGDSVLAHIMAEREKERPEIDCYGYGEPRITMIFEIMWYQKLMERLLLRPSRL